jgi:hypothetical protein
MKRRVLAGVIPNPAVGQDISYTFSQNEPVRLISLTAGFYASAVAGSRDPAFVLGDQSGASTFWTGPATEQTAGSNGFYSVSPQFKSAATSWLQGIPLQMVPFLEDWLPAGSVFRTQTNLQAGDTWTNINFLAEYGGDAWSDDARQAAAQAAISVLFDGT